MLYPPVCSFCEQLIPHQDFLPHETSRFVCRACESNLPFRLNAEIIEDRTPFVSAASFYYEDTIAFALRLFKFHERSDFARALAPYMVATYRRLEFNCDFVLPVPLHWERERSRGYNQAALLAKLIAKELQLPYSSALLERHKASNRQSECKTRRERLENVKNIFLVDKKMASKCRGLRALLVDDVLTSGATLTEAGKSLYKSGIDVLGLTCAAGQYS